MNYLEFNSPDVLFRKPTRNYIYEKIINPNVENFLNARGVNIVEAKEIRGHISITDLNFKAINISYFYNRLLKDAKNEKGYGWKRFYTITFDNKLAVKKCQETGLFYNEMFLGKIPILFFIYFDLQKILDEVRIFAQQRVVD